MALAVGVLIAAIAAIFSVYRIEDGKLESRSLQYSSASTQLLVDSPSSVLGNLKQSFEPLSARALVYANFMASPAVLDVIGEQVGLSGEQIYAAGPVSAQQPRVVQEPTALKRNIQITGESTPYRLNFNYNVGVPTINVYAQAPTTRQAVGLANASVVGLKRYVTSLENANGVSSGARVTIRQLGPASGSVVNGGISKSLAVMVFVAVFLVWCLLILVTARFRENWRASATLYGELNGEDEAAVAVDGAGDRGEPDVAPSPVPANGAHALHPELTSPELAPFQTLSVHEGDRPRASTGSAR